MCVHLYVCVCVYVCLGVDICVGVFMCSAIVYVCVLWTDSGPNLINYKAICCPSPSPGLGHLVSSLAPKTGRARGEGGGWGAPRTSPTSGVSLKHGGVCVCV